MPSPAWGLDPANIAKVLENDFEFFCRQLLDFEANTRHDWARVSGPPRKFRSDGGEDLEVLVVYPPRKQAAAYGGTLSGDDPGRYHYCCKTGQHWRTGLKGDALKERSLETVSEGGWLVLVVNLQLSPDEHRAVLDEVVDAMAVETGIDRALIAEKVSLKDANDLASTFAGHYFVLHAETRASLELPSIPGLVDTEEWFVKQEAQRGLPSFVADELRSDALVGLGETIDRDDGEARVVWVWGAPGAGKTRLIAEAIAASPSARMRALFSEDVDSGVRVVKADDLPKRPGVLLVVDECPKDEVDDLASSFLARARGQGGTLVLIGPQGGEGSLPAAPSVSLHVLPLDADAARRLVERELGLGDVAPPGLVERVLRLTEGYPWFAVLLARALQSDPSALPDGSGEWDAAALAIAGPKRDYGGNAAAWNAEVQRRAKTLLAVILTEGVDWRTLTEDDEEKLSAALGLAWDDIKDCALVCADRGIIRVRQAWRFKYVTPSNLARLVACKLLSGPDPPSRRIREHVPQLADALYRKLELLGVPPALLGSLADEALAPLTDASLDELARLPLTFLAKQRPAAVARTLRRAIEATSIEVLRASEGIRRNVMFALNHVCRRREGFEDAEAAIFRLALAENETWGNNATGVWKDLFLGALSLTHRPFDNRLNILERRLAEGDEASRLLALQGLGHAVGGEGVGPGYTDDEIDGDWPMPTMGEVKLGKERAWRLLFALTEDELLGHAARELAKTSLWGAAYWGVAELALRGLADRVGTWTEKERAELRETLGNMQRGGREVSSDVERLTRALEPGTYHGKLLDVVGQWMPLGAREASNHFAAERSLDRELASEGLAEPEVPLAQELEWLETEEAVRAEAFMLAVGTVDQARRLLRGLISRAEADGAKRTLPAYLGGIAEAGGEAEVDALLRSWRSDHLFASHTLLTIWRVGPSDERIGWLTEDIDARRVDASECGILAFGSWSARASPEQMRRLITSLSARDDQTTSLAALWIALDDYASVAPTEAGNVVAELVNRVASGPLTGMGSYKWREACIWLSRHGFAANAVEAAFTAIRSAEHYGMDADAWAVIQELTVSAPEAVWDGLAQMIDDSSDDRYRVVLEAQSHGLSQSLPADRVMDWVGRDQDKALLAALMCDVHHAELGALPVALLERFGPESPAARELGARAHSTLSPVGSLADFAREQLENARTWARDPRAAVAAWGQKMVEQLESSYESHAAEEEYEHRNRM